MFEQFTLGIEEEFQIVDPQTRELRSHVTEFLEEGKMILGEQIKPEMIQSMIEVGTGICATFRKRAPTSTRLRGIISCWRARKDWRSSPPRRTRFRAGRIRRYLMTSVMNCLSRSCKRSRVRC